MGNTSNESQAGGVERRAVPDAPDAAVRRSYAGSGKGSGGASGASLPDRLARRGFRFTPQREHVYGVLLRKRDHPTAEEVFIRAKRHMPEISMATVYNCLDALVKSGLARQLTLERGAARFCPNMSEHCHFYCDSCESVFDIDLPPEPGVALPEGFRAERFDVTIHGRCPACEGEGNKK